MAIFQSDADRRCYLQHVKEETERFGVKILSWCLMTNHVHFIAVPGKRHLLPEVSEKPTENIPV